MIVNVDKCSCDSPTLTMEWRDCPKTGHEEGCFGELCAECDNFIYLDCEDY